VSLLKNVDGLSTQDLHLKKGENSYLFKRFKGFIREKGLLEGASSVLVALSGGPDSVCLLNLLYLLTQKLNLKIYAAHFNHKLRGEEADRDSNFSQMICKANAIPIYIESKDVGKFAKEKRLNIQDAARKLRYGFLKRMAKEANIDLIATGHTADDQAEELLLRFLRGSALEGLSGIRARRTDNIIRPLLFAKKREILRHLQTYDIPFVEDSSNLTNKYTRNKIRRLLIPLIKSEFNPSITTTLSRTAFILQDDEDALMELALKAFNHASLPEKSLSSYKDNLAVTLSIEVLNRYHRAVKRRALLIALEKAGVPKDKILADHLLKLQHIVEKKNEPSGSYRLPEKFLAIRIYDKLLLTKAFNSEKKTESHQDLLVIKKIGTIIFATPVGLVNIQKVDFEQAMDSIVAMKNKATFPKALYLDAEKLSFPFQIRFRRPGDKFRPFGAQEERKLKKFFIARNIPKIFRDFVPLIIKEQKIAALCGIEIGDDFKVTGKKALKISWEPDEPLKSMLSLLA